MFRIARTARLRQSWRSLPARRLAQFSPKDPDWHLPEDPYERLGVSATASPAELRRAYYRKAKDCHPDLHGEDPAMAAKFRQLTEAYEVLRDAGARKQHDEERGVGGSPARGWRPGDGPRREDMEGNKRETAWQEVLRDKEILRQAREEYWEEVKQDLGEAASGALAGDFRPLRQFVQEHPGVVAGGALLAVPVLLVTRSPGLFLVALRSFALIPAVLVWPAVGALYLDLPDKIWRARVAAAKRSLERRKAKRSASSADASDAGDGGVKSGTGTSKDAASASSADVSDAGEGGVESGTGTSKDAVVAAGASRESLPKATGGVPNLVYLDDSSSMVCYRLVPEGAFSLSRKFRWEETCLEAGRNEFAELARFLEGTPTRVVKFGGISEDEFGDVAGRQQWYRKEEMLRTLLLETADFQSDSDLGALLKSWDGTSQGTYMWKMIETDILETYHPSTPIRVHLITDGEDTHSPEPFRGIKGMDALQASLRAKGYRIQWNIILLLFGAHCFDAFMVHQYKELCDSSGGAFYIASDRYEHSQHRVEAHLEEAVRLHATAAARQKYLDHCLAARTDVGDGIEVPRLPE